MKIGETYQTVYGSKAEVVGAPDAAFVIVKVGCPWGGEDRIVPIRRDDLLPNGGTR